MKELELIFQPRVELSSSDAERLRRCIQNAMNRFFPYAVDVSAILPLEGSDERWLVVRRSPPRMTPLSANDRVVLIRDAPLFGPDGRPLGVGDQVSTADGSSLHLVVSRVYRRARGRVAYECRIVRE